MAADRKRRGRWIWILVLLVLGALSAALLLRPKPPLEVETVRVTRGEVRELIASAAAGEVRPARRVTVRAEIPGTVVEVKRRRGERVERKEALVVFDAGELQAREAQARANLQAAEVALAAARTRIGTAERAEKRAQTLAKGGAISDAELDRVVTELAASRHALEQAAAARRQAQAALDLARISKERAVVEAPYAGVLQDVFAEVGVQVAPGAPLFDLIDDREIYVDLPVDEADAPRVHVGQTVVLSVDASRGSTLTGKVRFVPLAVGRSSQATGFDPAAQAVKRDRFLYVEVVPDRPEALRIGATVNAELLISAKEDVPFVPTHVVIGRGVERQVYVVKNGRAVLVPFRAGVTSWERTEVLSGLEVGTEVVSSLNAKGLADGVRIVVRGSEPAAGAPAPRVSAKGP